MTLADSFESSCTQTDPDPPEDALPNNDFDQYSPSDFLETQGAPESDTHHLKYICAWEEIHALIGREIQVGDGRDKIAWKVVPGVFQDDMEELIESQEKTKGVFDVFADSEGNEKKIFECFQSLWPGDFFEDLESLNHVFQKINMERKKKYQKPFRLVTRSEFITFHALIIAS